MLTQKTTRRIALLLALVMVPMGLAPSVLAAGEGDDGPFYRSTFYYRVRAQVVDYDTLGAPGGLASITIRRGQSVWNNSFVSNKGYWYGIKTQTPGRTYTITCYYRGQTCTKTAVATEPPKYVTFYYYSGGRLG